MSLSGQWGNEIVPLNCWVVCSWEVLLLLFWGFFGFFEEVDFMATKVMS